MNPMFYFEKCAVCGLLRKAAHVCFLVLLAAGPLAAGVVGQLEDVGEAAASVFANSTATSLTATVEVSIVGATATQQMPFSPTDWPNPARPRPVVQTEMPQNTLPLRSTLPAA
jgi:hypothetical protein